MGALDFEGRLHDYRRFVTRLAERCIGVIVVVALTLVCSGCPGGGGGGSITVSGGKVDFGDPWFETPDKLCVKVTVSQGAANVIVDVTVGAQGGHTSHFNIPPGMYKICEDLPGSLTDGAHFTVKKS